MDYEIFRNISKIIERDSKATTYKLALLRGVIDIIQDNSPYIKVEEKRVHFPTGLLVEKWLMYYYPILESTISIPQINGTAKLAFEVQFHEIIFSYQSQGGFSVFYNDLKNNRIPEALHEKFLALSKKLKETITRMPMRYIGRSISNSFYSVFQIENQGISTNSPEIDLELLINNSGSFSIPLEYYEAFKILGSFINGQDSILFKWAEFSVKASMNQLSVEKVLNEVLRGPITERETSASKSFYEGILAREHSVLCVWTGEKITCYDVDHVIPFSVWKNNDLWNLLPSTPNINRQKLDKIPSPAFIESRKQYISYYWNLIHEFQKERFQKEIRVSLLGYSFTDGWQEQAIKQLKSRCNYLISSRGFEEWKI